MNVPSTIDVTVTTTLGPFTRSGEQVTVSIAPDGSTGDVTVERSIYDPYEDETPADYRPPADPRRWKAGPEVTRTPAIRDAVAGMRAALEAVDWSNVTKDSSTATDGEHTRIALRFADRPTGMEHLEPVHTSWDDSWFVGIRESNDLYTSPQLQPVIDAALAVVAAARAVAAPTDR